MNRDPYPIYTATDEGMTTRGYEELAELGRGPEQRETGRDRKGAQPTESTVDKGERPVPEALQKPHSGIMKGTEVEVTFEAR